MSTCKKKEIDEEFDIDNAVCYCTCTALLCCCCDESIVFFKTK